MPPASIPLHVTITEYRLDERLRSSAIICGEEVGLAAKTNVRIAKAILARPLQLLVINAEHRESAIGKDVANLVEQHMRRLGAREGDLREKPKALKSIGCKN